MNIPFSRKQILLVLIAAAAIIAAVVIFLVIHSGRPSEAVLQGRGYLEQMEQGDPTEVDDRLAQIEEEKVQANLDALRQALLQDPDKVWEQFTDFVILGDSRAEGFSAYEFLPSSRVMAEKGLLISYLYSDEVLQRLQQLQPTKIWLVFGNNDIGDSQNPGWLENWIGNYREAVEAIQKILPNAMVCVCSVLPVTEPSSEEPYFDAIPAVNEALAGMCAQTGAVFEDASAQLEGHPEYFEPDGMHFTIGFYPVWATDMLLTYYDNVGRLDAVKSGEETADEAITDAVEESAAARDETYEEDENPDEDGTDSDGNGEDGSDEETASPIVAYWDDYAQLFYYWDEEAQEYLYLEDWAQPYVYWDDAAQQYLFAEPAA